MKNFNFEGKSQDEIVKADKFSDILFVVGILQFIAVVILSILGITNMVAFIISGIIAIIFLNR